MTPEPIGAEQDLLRGTQRSVEVVERRLGDGRESRRPAMMTDLGNAERLVRRHGRDLRFAHGIGWLVWDGRRWARDTNEEVVRRAKDTVRSIYLEAARAEDDDERKALGNWARSSEAERRLRAMVRLAESEPDLIVSPGGLDPDAMLLNARNGTVDLTTGGLRPHRREDLITKVAGADYDPAADPRLWKRFVTYVTGEDSELEAFLRRAAGYSLTGSTTEEVVFFAHGPTATGKSTFLEALKCALGEYAATASFESFLVRRGDGGVRSDIARLAGREW